MKTIQGMFDYSITGDERFEIEVSCESAESGLEYVHISMHSDEMISPQPVKLSWQTPLTHMFNHWYPGSVNAQRTVGPPWAEPRNSCIAYSAPVFALYGNNNNALTIAVSDAMNNVRIFAAPSEQTACCEAYVSFFDSPIAPLCDYNVTVRLDARNVLLRDSLEDVSKWWAAMENYKPAYVPEYAKLPMYSTWYSFHQDMTCENVEAQCKLAKEIGCESVIVDDGWQTEDNSLGYAWCGDWEVAEKKMGDMAAHVQRVHELGMKYLLWYSVPFVGFYNKAAKLFEGKTIGRKEDWKTYILDPRYKEVRDYLIATYERGYRDWGLDGFKLDFIDSFKQPKPEDELADLGRDETSVPIAVDKLMSNVIKRLRSLNPEVMIEFRQNYVGPLMRKYGNMFRAHDCPNDAFLNRIRTVDIRLICGNTAAHSDMLMWHENETVEDAAQQLLNVFFSVPQISVLLDKIPQSHFDMLKFYLGIWREYRDVLLGGKFMPYEPSLLYPLITADDDNVLFAVFYAQRVLPVAEAKGEIAIINSSFEDQVYVDFQADLGEYNATAFDCMGNKLYEKVISADGLVKVGLARSGFMKLVKR